jgi:UDP-N-acetylglucosamine--N-acetylmuramyl-(pentapeptide) pyrophosphoryl-undecaprenol N-acetylglucosamine transferase
MSPPKIIIAAGGTGGHLIPAQALAEELKGRGAWVGFVGAGLATTPYFDREQYPFFDISSATFSFYSPLRALRAFPILTRGILRARTLLTAIKPALVVGFGSYHSFPVLAAARWQRIPILLHAADAIPGRVVRLFARVAKLTGVAIPDAAAHLKGNIELIPTPLRAAYSEPLPSRSQARQQFGLEPNDPTLLVFGGSQGAHQLNQIVCAALEGLSGWQVIHITGFHDPPGEIARRYQTREQRHYVAAYEEKMVAAWAAADLAIMRAGASSVGELLAMRVPAILVPYPHAADAHQAANAAWVERIGGAIHLPEQELSAERLRDCLKTCTLDRLQQMRFSLATHQANPKRRLVDCVWEIMGEIGSI